MLKYFSDASGSWGCGAYSGSQWFQLAWSSGAAKYQIAVKEHLPVVLAVAVWGKDWKGLDVTCHSDNQAVVSVIRSRTSEDPDIMHSLSFIEARYEFFLSTGQRFYAQQRLSILDLAVDNPVNPVKRSKTDQFHKGTCVCIGCTGDDLCPVATFMAYLAVRGMKQGPLFQTKDGLPVSREFAVNNVCQVLQALGLESSHCAGHNFRIIGAATTAAYWDIPDSTVKVLEG